jgi:hypothetical protein
MKEFELEDGNVLLAGNVVLVLLDSFGSYRARGEKVIARYLADGEKEIDPHGHYPLQKILYGLRDLSEQFGTGFLNRVGRHVFEHAHVPPGLETIDVFLAATNQAYQMNHRNADGKIGSYAWTQVTDRSGRMTCDNPYPCAFDEGLFSGIGTMFGVELTVTHEDEASCRRRGGEQCTYLLEW